MWKKCVHSSTDSHVYIYARALNMRTIKGTYYYGQLYSSIHYMMKDLLCACVREMEKALNYYKLSI